MAVKMMCPACWQELNGYTGRVDAAPHVGLHFRNEGTVRCEGSNGIGIVVKPPAENRVGELPHAYPEHGLPDDTCKACGAAIFRDGMDDAGTAIWTHAATLDYFCEVSE